MIRNDINILIGVKKATMRIAASCLLLFFLAGNAMAQSDRQYVIKKGDHYLAHVYNETESQWELQDVVVDNTSNLNFSPNCLWYSSNNYNYYFMDGTTKMYLKAPLVRNGIITFAANPGTQTLNNITQDYFFYDWDHGLARGIQHFGGGCDPMYNSGNGDEGECWEAVWVSYESDNTWKMSSDYGYDPTPNAAHFFSVSITEHPAVTTTVVVNPGENPGLADLVGFSLNYNESHLVRPTINDYQFATTPAYTTYLINESPQSIHNYWGDEDHGTATPGSVYSAVYEATSVEYSWELSGEGATYLSFAATGSLEHTSTVDEPTVYYRTPNNTGHKEATLTLTVTYHKENQPDVQQTSSATIMVNTPCQNPPVGGLSATVNSLGAIISWTPTAESYVVSWRKTGTPTWNSASVGNVNSYTITGLEYGEVVYEYKVRATCDVEPTYTYPTFTTGSDPGLLVVGAVFGGGRMADVGGKTEVVIINCGSIDAVYGGNDIAGSVISTDGSTITLGVNENDPNSTYDDDYGHTTANFNIGSVYGGGNGYYAYNGSSFVPASDDFNSYDVEENGHVNAMTPEHEVGGVVWNNTGTGSRTLDFPSIVKTAITVTNDNVKVDSIFGGAKNAFLTFDDYNANGSSITINGGTVLAVFGGNNFGGTQKRGKHYIEVNGTTTNLAPNITNTATTGYGRTFGIRYLFGGGNKVYGSTTDVYINGGQCDTIFAGGNAADVYAANVTVNCTIAAPQVGADYVYGSIYSNAIDTYTGGVITPLTDYGWDGINGIYNVRTLFGGNNMATFDSKLNHKVPTITLTSGSIGTVYGGGNSGDMWGLSTDDGTLSHGTLTINGEIVKYGTHVKMESPTILIDYLYGGCQMSDVRYGTWVELKEGHVGTVYGGCNVSGDVGSTRVNMDAPEPGTPTFEYQEVYGGTWVVADGGIVYKNLFAGGNGYYHCLNNNGIYVSGLNYTNHNYVGLAAPTHNETHVLVNDGALVKGDVYAGGNLARVGFDNSTVGTNPFPKFVGWASVKMSGGTVNGNVYGGGNMADVNGSNEVQVSGGTIDKSLYGGNDRMGKVAQISNRKLPSSYDYASDQATSLLDPKVYTYVSVTGAPSITNVYGGGNGDYAYFTDPNAAASYTGPKETVVSCDVSNQPIQRCTFVDIGIQGGATGGHIGTVYGGGDGVTVTEFLKVFLNVQGDNPIGYSNVGTIFGGNNKGDLELVADIVLLKGQVNTVYGGCNEGAMTAYGANLKTIGGYPNIGSYVRLLASYDPDNDPSTNNSVTPNIKVMDAIYGGCRMNGVRGEDLEHNTYPTNSLVLVEGGDFSDMTRGIFGGSDISGHVSGKSQVAVTGGTVGDVYGGGNGGYYYGDYNPTTDTYNVYMNQGDTEPLATGVGGAPSCNYSGVDIWSGQVGADANHTGKVFGGGFGQLTSTDKDVEVNIGVSDAVEADPKPLIYGEIYGGSALGNVNFNSSHSTTVNFLNGTLVGSLYGGGLGNNTVEAKVKGKVFVNISSSTQEPEHCFIDLRNARVYGCNNTNGSPQDDVEVHVYKTGYTTGDYSPTGSLYAIKEVFGGGNRANYTASGKTAKVYVHGCLNTIERVFSGGNAASATGVAAEIDGGGFDYVFGGGNGEVSAADIGDGGTDLLVKGGIINHLFGGSNKNGSISGTINTVVNNESGCAEEITEFFGGSNVAPLELASTSQIHSVINCCGKTIHEAYGGSKSAYIIGNVVLDVKGGTIIEVYGGSKGCLDCGDGGTPIAANITGNVTLNLEGGTIATAFGGSNVNGNITGSITVNVIDIEQCPLIVTNIFGGGNHAEYTPNSSTIISPLVNVMHTVQAEGVKGNVFGGGNEASVTSNPRVNIGYNAADMPNAIPSDVNTSTLTSFPHTYVKGNVFGGGNNITTADKGVVGNTAIYVYNGEVCQSWGDAQSVGIYGGCNTSGTVTGKTDVILLGGIVGNSTTRANIHGGGFGSATEVKGNVTVNFGGIVYDTSGENPVEIHTDEPILYGDLYGGSALGNINTNNTQETKVNILNGEILGVVDPDNLQAQYGNVFGGGLGDDTHAALVRGRVYVKVGACGTAPSSNLTGKAKLIKCLVYGCNNVSGSPQDDVYVDVYQTDHIEGVNTVNNGDDYAILRVFGGGNQSNYAPENNDPNSQKKTHVYIHSCDNTIKYVYGGGNAAAAVGVETLIEGGRFREIYGGGNGTRIPADIGLGGIGINVNGGHASYYFEGCNHLGTIAGPINQPRPTFPAGYIVCDGGVLTIDSYYFGDNEAEHYGDLVGEITCEQASHFNYKYVFAGSRWAIVYGDVKLTVKGGNIQYLYGGSKGYGDQDEPIPADIRRFPSYAELDADDLLPELEQKYSSLLKAYMRDPNHPERAELVGHGGNVLLVVQGGTIGDVIGGCEELGNVEGKITVIIDALEGTACPLVLGNVYGASKETDYTPINDDTHHAYFEPGTTNAVPTPQVKILKGTVGSDTPVQFIVSEETHPMEGNVFGGGDSGNVTANPKVIVGESSNTNNVEIKGNVFGGGKQGAVNGSTEVIVVPKKYELTITAPDATQGVIRVTDRQGNTVNSEDEIDEYQDLNLVAIPSAYGWKLDKWEVTNGSVLFEKSANTMFTMGAADATLTASFEQVDTHTLTVNPQGEGSVAVTDAQGQNWTGAAIGEGAVLNIVASPTPNSGYTFLRWEVSGTGSTVANVNRATTTFTMGTANTTLTAVFVPTHQLTIGTPEHGTITVTDIHGQPVATGAYIGEGAALNIVAHPDDNYHFVSWELTNGTASDPTAISTTFVMGNGTGGATITTTFVHD